jgi:1L-myo-inositol 1-phosphate cytidylyltransferase
MRQTISTAVILMAGSGSRLRRGGETSPKPLVMLGKHPLISYTFDTLVKAGIETIYAVTGFEEAALRTGIMPLIPHSIDLNWIENQNWQKQNGISLLTAEPIVKRPFILTMGDHVFGPEIIDRLVQQADLNTLNVAVDRKLGGIVDLDDAMKVKTEGNRVVAIGKSLEEYHAIDIGLFVCPLEIFTYLEQAKRDGDCSLADGVRSMAADGKVRAIDIGNAWWQDVDSAETLQHARQLVAKYHESLGK